MGCLFSTPTTEDQEDRHRKNINAQQEEPLIPNPTESSRPMGTANIPETASPALTIGSRPNQGRQQSGQNFNARLLGASYTDKAQREKQNFNNIVQQARQAFIDISAQHRPHVTQLSYNALQLTAAAEQLLSNEPVPNLRGGFFEAKIPQSVFNTLDPDINSMSDNSVNNAVSTILGEPDMAIVELAYLCAQETCMALARGAIPLIPNSLVITQAEFADDGTGDFEQDE
eukprot:UN03422